MARRRTSTRRSARSVRWVAWTPVMAEAFRLGQIGDWKAPTRVRVSQGEKSMTLTARFADGEGQIMTARLRLRRDAHSWDWRVVAEEISLPVLTIRGGAR